MVSSFVIAPYTSYWQPEQPTYNPVEACFQLTHPEVNQGEPYYESPRFRVLPSMTVSGDLPLPFVVGFGCVFVVGLFLVVNRTIYDCGHEWACFELQLLTLTPLTERRERVPHYIFATYIYIPRFNGRDWMRCVF